jgi:hypothetical protein
MFQTFADQAMAMRRYGWAVLPAKGKSPIVENFPNWHRAPGAKSIEDWAKKYPAADIVFVAGLCSPRKDKRGVIVVDADDSDASDHTEELFGQTPGRVQTRRGVHHYYDASRVDCGKLPPSLRGLGLNADLKHGQGGAAIIAAPPSRHEKEPEFRYTWLDCGPSVLSDLPAFPIKVLQRLLEKDQERFRTLKRDFRDGSRKQGLNDYLVGQVCFCDTFDELLDVARTWNQERLADHAKGPLEDAIVIARASVVWRQRNEEGRFEPWHHGEGVAKVDLRELNKLLALDSKGAGDAVALLAFLRVKHAARCRRGETFVLTPKAMERNQVLKGWTRERYEKARDLLLKAGLVVRVRDHDPRSNEPAQYIMNR